MTQPRHNDANLTQIFKYTAIVTALMAVFNAVFSQWILVVFFAIIAIATGVVAWKKTQNEQRATLGREDSGLQERR
ncbi:hypothetical protein ACFSYH_03980 [Populibacterium corticicola]|uniref:Secreted protein n=1 Tax=Populibacterium corticicola TaxID=1812826 RepID=A0ABW5XER7_9MICO